MLGLIWAQSGGARPVIGRDGGLPWHLPEDLAHFRAVTQGHPVLMGRRTWESLPPRFRPLPGRENIVLTTRPGWAAAGATVVGSPTAALAAVGDREAWVTGGAAVYAAFLPRADVIELTEVDLDLGAVRDGDVLAPDIGAGWQRHDEGWQLSRTGLRYRFSTLRR